MCDLLVQDRSDDSEDSQGEDGHQDELTLQRQTCNPKHTERNDNQSSIGRDVEDHLDLRVMCVGGTLFVFNGNSPILVERSAEDRVVADLNDQVAEPDVDDKAIQDKLESW